VKAQVYKTAVEVCNIIPSMNELSMNINRGQIIHFLLISRPCTHSKLGVLDKLSPLDCITDGDHAAQNR